MWIPTSLYEALPAIYLTIGVSIILCTLYIGVGDGLLLGYLMLGTGCVIAGILVKTMRTEARSKEDRPRT